MLCCSGLRRGGQHIAEQMEALARDFDDEHSVVSIVQISTPEGGSLFGTRNNLGEPLHRTSLREQVRAIGASGPSLMPPVEGREGAAMGSNASSAAFAEPLRTAQAQ